MKRIFQCVMALSVASVYAGEKPNSQSDFYKNYANPATEALGKEAEIYKAKSKIVFDSFKAMHEVFDDWFKGGNGEDITFVQYKDFTGKTVTKSKLQQSLEDNYETPLPATVIAAKYTFPFYVAKKSFSNARYSRAGKLYVATCSLLCSENFAKSLFSDIIFYYEGLSKEERFDLKEGRESELSTYSHVFKEVKKQEEVELVVPERKQGLFEKLKNNFSKTLRRETLVMECYDPAEFANSELTKGASNAVLQAVENAPNFQEPANNEERSGIEIIEETVTPLEITTDSKENYQVGLPVVESN